MSVTFTKLFASITESTVWCEPDSTRLVWITMLAMADSRGRVWASVPGLANRARVSVDSTRAAIATFLSPDPDSRTPDHEGRRIEAIDGGWRLLNHDKYRNIRDEESIKESKRRYINARRAKERESSSTVENVERGRYNADAEADAEAVNLSQAKACVDPPAEKPPSCPSCPIQEIIELYHQTLPELPRVVVMNEKRNGLIRQRWRDFYAAGDFKTKDGGLECFRWYFTEKVKPSKFLTGRANGNSKDRSPFLADMEWLVRPTNFAKVIEGRYEEH